MQKALEALMLRVTVETRLDVEKVSARTRVHSSLAANEIYCAVG